MGADKRPGEPSKCRSCGAEIVWVVTTRGKSMPCDLTPASEGGFYLFRLAERIEAVHVDGNDPRAEKASKRGDRRYASHFQTCVNAAQHRRSR